MAKTFEQECAEGRFEFNPNRSFEERCEIVRRTDRELRLYALLDARHQKGGDGGNRENKVIKRIYQEL